MTNASRVSRDGPVCFAECWSLFATSWAQTAPANSRTDRQDLWSRFVWTNRSDPLYLERRDPRVFKLSHTWEWEPKTGKVTYEGKDKDGKPVKVTYMRSELSSQPGQREDRIDPAFVNDNYWLLFPSMLTGTPAPP